jgi:hypothetical protein
MSRGPQRFRKREVTRAIKAAEDAGKTVAGVEIDPATGKIAVKFGEGASSTETVNEWDEAA